MKDKSFEIKVADLLNQTGKKDEIHFENKFTDQLPNLDAEGISGDIFLQSLSKDSLLLSLVDVKCCIEDTCDICQDYYNRNVENDFYEAKFILPEYDNDEESETEEIFPIDPKSENINIEDMLVQAIILKEPLVKRCKKCLKKSIDIENSNDDDLGYFEGKTNINFN
ncbi:hypothetical protein K9M48_03030 [Candidatus Gracilibacteria bacterium]|nr:hypothetical protein [Candidatus Gracilibacteria bacterium]